MARSNSTLPHRTHHAPSTTSGKLSTRLATLVVAATAALLIAGCGEQDAPSPPQPTGSFQQQLDSVRTVEATDGGDRDIEPQAAVGSCIAIDRMYRGIDQGSGQPRIETVITDRSCDDAPLIVLQRAAQPDTCIADADLKRVFTSGDGPASVTLCLDYNWREGQCLAMGTDNAVTVDCSDEAAKAMTPQKVVAGNYTDGACDEQAIVHTERKFSVCIKNEAPQ